MRIAVSPRCFPIMAACILAAAHWQSACAQTWTQRSPTTSPPARGAHQMVYDAARRHVILFGGSIYSGNPASNDTWAFDGTTWTQLKPKSSPPARTYHAMAYDTRRQRVVLFGGERVLGRLNDTWEWDGATWTQQHPRTSPPTVANHAMAYDAARQRVVLYGFANASNPHTTWEWDGTNWTQCSPKTKPPNLTFHAMAYDAHRQRVVLFGGGAWNGSTYVCFNDTWEWDGSTWTRRSPAVSPSPRGGHGLVYDPVRRRIVMFGGSSLTGKFDDTWEWDGRTWSRKPVSTTRPLAREIFGMAYDTARRQVVVFSGFDYRWTYPNDTWVYSGVYLFASGTARFGSTVSFFLAAPGNARRYYVLGSSLGAGPMLIDNRWIGLAPDHLLVASTSGNLPWIFSGYRGTFDSGGKAIAALNIPNMPALVGTRVLSAFVTLEPKAPSGVWSISNTETVTIVK